MLKQPCVPETDPTWPSRTSFCAFLGLICQYFVEAVCTCVLERCCLHVPSLVMPLSGRHEGRVGLLMVFGFVLFQTVFTAIGLSP